MPLLIPYSELSSDALIGVIKSFILQEGTDYGLEESTIDEKIERVMNQLKSGKAQIAFDEESGTAYIITSHEAQKHSKVERD